MTTAAKTALITGGAKRIGKAIVKDLAAHGYSVAIHANTSCDAAEALAASIRLGGGRAAVVRGDLASLEDTDRLVGEAAATLGPLGLVVNNASLFKPDTVDTFDAASWETHFSVNLRAPVMLTQAFAATLGKDESGVVVNIIDQRVWRLTPKFFSYTLAKSALWTATQTLSQGLAPKVRVNAIGPGPTLANERQSMKDFHEQTKRLPMREGPSLDEFGRTVRYLFETPSITGQMIALDGGQHLAWQTPDVADIRE